MQVTVSAASVAVSFRPFARAIRPFSLPRHTLSRQELRRIVAEMID